jgi:hypothetical protein
MKLGRFLLFMIIPCLLVSCAPMSRYQAVDSPSLRQASQNARTLGDHLALTQHYENLAREMQANAGEQQKLLNHYQEKSYLYGRQAQDRQSHTWALMVKYEQAAKTSLSKAALHRQIAADLGQHKTPAGERLTQAKVRAPAEIGNVRADEAGEKR